MTKYKIFLKIKPKNSMGLRFEIPYLECDNKSKNTKQEILEVLSRAEISFEQLEEEEHI